MVRLNPGVRVALYVCTHVSVSLNSTIPIVIMVAATITTGSISIISIIIIMAIITRTVNATITIVTKPATTETPFASLCRFSRANDDENEQTQRIERHTAPCGRQWLPERHKAGSCHMVLGDYRCALVYAVLLRSDDESSSWRKSRWEPALLAHASLSSCQVNKVSRLGCRADGLAQSIKPKAQAPLLGERSWFACTS